MPSTAFDTYQYRTTYLQSGCYSVILSVLLSFCSVCMTYGQDNTTNVTPEVQTLYAEAKDAEAHGDTHAAIVKYQSIIKMAPGLAAGYNNLGVLYYDQHEYEKAIHVLQEALFINPNLPSASAILGSAYVAMGKDFEARAPLEKALEINPTDSQAEMTLARALINLQDYDAAVAHLKKLVRRNENDQDAWYLLSKSYIQLSKGTLAATTRINPNSALSHEISGELMESMQNMDGAAMEYKKAVDLAPERAESLYHLGNAYWLMGQWDLARDEFTRYAAKDPYSCVVQWKLGNATLEAGRSPKEALASLDNAATRCPEMTQARLDRARALIKLGRQTEALPELLAAKLQKPNEPSIHFVLASVYRSQGNMANAQAELLEFD